MLEFDLPFVRDATLRESLERDLADIRVNWENKRWKPVIVASGSVMEALLLDALLLKGVKATTGSNPNPVDKCALGDLIEEAERQKLVHGDFKNVAMAIKNYRNLIHPGREMRLKLAPTESTAYVAVGLLKSIVEEMKKGLTDPRRLTAQELMAKIQSTPDSMAVLETLLDPMWETDRLAFAKDLVPAAFLDGETEMISRAGAPFSAHQMSGAEVHQAQLKAARQRAYSHLYSRCFDSLQDTSKETCLAALADRVRRSGERHVRILIVNLFHTDHLRFAQTDDQRVLASAAAHELANYYQLDFWSACSGLLPNLTAADIFRIAPGACRCAFSQGIDSGAAMAKAFLRDAYRSGDVYLKDFLLRAAQAEDAKRIAEHERKKKTWGAGAEPESLAAYIAQP